MVIEFIKYGIYGPWNIFGRSTFSVPQLWVNYKYGPWAFATTPNGSYVISKPKTKNKPNKQIPNSPGPIPQLAQQPFYNKNPTPPFISPGQTNVDPPSSHHLQPDTPLPHSTNPLSSAISTHPMFP